MTTWTRLTEAQRSGVHDWSKRLDERDVSDDAHWWSEMEGGVPEGELPKNLGELKAMLAVAFDAGQMAIGLREISRRSQAQEGPPTDSVVPTNAVYREWQVLVNTTTHVFYKAEDVRAFMATALGAMKWAEKDGVHRVQVVSRLVVRHGEPSYIVAMVERVLARLQEAPK